MADTLLFIGGVAWMLSLLFFVFSIGVALLSFSASLFIVASILLAMTSGFMVVVGAFK